MPTYFGGFDVRRLPVTKKNETHSHYEDVVQEVDGNVISGPGRGSFVCKNGCILYIVPYGVNSRMKYLKLHTFCWCFVLNIESIETLAKSDYERHRCLLWPV